MLVQFLKHNFLLVIITLILLHNLDGNSMLLLLQYQATAEISSKEHLSKLALAKFILQMVPVVEKLLALVDFVVFLGTDRTFGCDAGQVAVAVALAQTAEV